MATYPMKRGESSKRSVLVPCWRQGRPWERSERHDWPTSKTVPGQRSAWEQQWPYTVWFPRQCSTRRWWKHWWRRELRRSLLWSARRAESGIDCRRGEHGEEKSRRVNWFTKMRIYVTVRMVLHFLLHASYSKSIKYSNAEKKLLA